MTLSMLSDVGLKRKRREKKEEKEKRRRREKGRRKRKTKRSLFLKMLFTIVIEVAATLITHSYSVYHVGLYYKLNLRAG